MQGFYSDLCLSPLPVQAFPICDLLQFRRELVRVQAVLDVVGIRLGSGTV